MSRLWIALGAYGVLGLLAWQTLDDRNIRLVTLAILGMFAVRSVLHARQVRAESEGTTKSYGARQDEG